MANKLKEFICYLEEQVTNHSIYVWGAQGQQGTAITEKWIRNRETSTANANSAISFWKKQCKAGYGEVLRSFDCSGLGMFWLQNVKHLTPSDMSANSLYKKSKKITKAGLRVGDFVFYINSSGKATHIGYVVDNDLNVIEARGRDYGVVKRGLSKGNWKAYGRPTYWTESEVKEIQGKIEAVTETGQVSEKFVFTRNLKYGCIGKDVLELKKLLTAKGYGGFTPGNENFYSLTKKKVKDFQQANGLEVDGVAGTITVKALQEV